MASNPPEVLLSEIVTIKGGKRLPAGKNLQSLPSKHPYIRVRDVGRRNLPREGIEYVPDDVFPSISRYIVQENDVVLSIVGTIGALSIVDNFYDYASLTENCVKLTGLDYHDALYLYYYLSSSVGQQEISKGTVGAVQPKLPIYNIEKIKVLWPDDKDRRKNIASVLGKLDDKIGLNRCINQTLEAMAQAIFKSWFVDFDPVKAKIAAIEQGQDPLRACMRAISGKTDAELDQMPREHHDQLAATAALFPDAMEESELGEIPKGWEVSTIGEMVEIAGGATPDTKNESYWNPPEYFWTSPKDLSSAQSPVLLATERKISTAGLSRIGSGLLPKGTLLMSSRAPIGYLAITQIPVAINQGYIAMLPGGKLPPLYLLMWCQQSMEEIKGQANGSTFMEISKKAFRPMPVLYAGSILADSFVEVASPLFGRIVEGLRESSQLSELRDTLLPKLLSGELSINE